MPPLPYSHIETREHDRADIVNDLSFREICCQIVEQQVGLSMNQTEQSIDLVSHPHLA
jgi:hypothetical protein